MYTDYNSDCTNAPAPQTQRDELARLRAIESAAREYRRIFARDDIIDGWISLLAESRRRLFALLDSPPVQ